MDLNDFAENIRTKEDFLQFLGLLLEDFQHNGECWENNDLESYIAAIRAFSSGIDGFYRNTNQSVNLDTQNWKVFADILLAAIVYE